MSPARETGFPLGPLLAGWAEVPACPEREVCGLCHDSRRLRPGDLFFALAGSRAHGMKHAGQAAAMGACAISGEALERERLDARGSALAGARESCK